MDNFDSEGPSDSEWEDRGELAWNEFDWERYLREQDETVHRYLGFYEAFRREPDRIDRVAEQMGWEASEAADGGEGDDDGADEDGEEADSFTGEEIYTLHKNPVFVATKAIYLSLKRPWELLAVDAAKVPPGLAVPFLASLHRGEEQAVQAVHALDFGDYAMAISLFKRALAALNHSLAQLDSKAAQSAPKAAAAYRDEAKPRLFDLREIWLRVINECRRELNRPVEEE